MYLRNISEVGDPNNGHRLWNYLQWKFLLLLPAFILTGCSSYMKLDEAHGQYIYYEKSYFTFIIDKNDLTHIIENDDWFKHPNNYAEQESIMEEIKKPNNIMLKELYPGDSTYDGNLELYFYISDHLPDLFKKKRIVVYNNYTKQSEKYHWKEINSFVAGEMSESFQVYLLRNGNIIYQ